MEVSCPTPQTKWSSLEGKGQRQGQGQGQGREFFQDMGSLPAKGRKKVSR